MKHQGKIFSVIYIACIIAVLLISTGCSQTNARSHIGTVAGGVSGLLPVVHYLIQIWH